MSNFDAINEALDIDCVPEPEVHDLTNISDENLSEKVLDTDPMEEKDRDYQYARAQLFALIEKGQEAVNGALELATEGDSARSYEVAINGIKSISEVTEKLLDLHKKVRDINAESVTTNQTNVTNNSVFVGSTSDLHKLIKEGLRSLPEENK